MNTPKYMETLTSKDVQSLLHAIQQLYASHDFSTFGTTALALVHQLVPSEFPAFSISDFQAHQLTNTFLPGYPSFTPEMEEASHRYWGEHPFIQNMPRTLNSAHKISDFITQAELHQLEGLYQRFLRAMNCEYQMTLFLPHSNPQSHAVPLQVAQPVVAISLNRSQPDFTERDRLILNLLRPHLFQAYCNARYYEKLTQSMNHLGLIILNDTGHIESITLQATEYLQRYFTNIAHSRQIPEHLWSWIRHQMQCLPEPRLPLHIEQAGKQLSIRLIIEQPEIRYLLLLEEQPLSPLPSLQLLGLSAREAEVLLWVIRGKDNRAIANRLDIHLSTVRKHLESIYRKLDVQSRTAAMAQALEKLGILHFQ